MKRNVCRIGSAAVCAALCLTLGCSCSVLPPASGKPAAPASSVPTDAHGDPLYDSSRLDDGKLRILYGYDNSGGACTVLCGSKVLYQSFRSENVNLLQDTVTGETNYWFRTWADPDAYCGRRSGLFDKDGNEVMTFEEIVYNLAQQDMVALRVVMRMGWALPNPATRMNADRSKVPFAFLTAAAVAA